MSDQRLTPDLRGWAQPEELTPQEKTRRAVEFGLRLREAREAAGLSLRDLGGRGGFSPSFLSDVEHGRRWPTRNTAAALEVKLAAAILRRGAK